MWNLNFGIFEWFCVIQFARTQDTCLNRSQIQTPDPRSIPFWFLSIVDWSAVRWDVITGDRSQIRSQISTYSLHFHSISLQRSKISKKNGIIPCWWQGDTREFSAGKASSHVYNWWHSWPIHLGEQHISTAKDKLITDCTNWSPLCIVVERCPCIERG